MYESIKDKGTNWSIAENFENALSAYVVLTAFIPMLMDSGGNAGSQASVTIIRSLALNEVEFRDIFKVIWKEIRVAILLALCLAVACFAKLQLIDRLIFGYDYTIKISLVVSIALFCTICIAKIVGSCLPLLAKKFKLDPAVVASPFITTIVDAISLIVFCGLSLAIL
jgi:magnesium transporter